LATDLDKLKVRAAPELMAVLEDRKYDSHHELTEYALAHGVEVPEGYEPGCSLSIVFDRDGNELGLYWDGCGPSDEDDEDSLLPRPESVCALV
jgi:hypothetical protein